MRDTSHQRSPRVTTSIEDAPHTASTICCEGYPSRATLQKAARMQDDPTVLVSARDPRGVEKVLVLAAPDRGVIIGVNSQTTGQAGDQVSHAPKTSTTTSVINHYPVLSLPPFRSCRCRSVHPECFAGACNPMYLRYVLPRTPRGRPSFWMTIISTSTVPTYGTVDLFSN